MLFHLQYYTPIHPRIIAAAKDEDFYPEKRNTQACEYCAQSHGGHHFACPFATEGRREQREKRNRSIRAHGYIQLAGAVVETAEV